MPKLPKYKNKNGESIAIFTNQNSRIKNGYIHFPKSCNLTPIKTRVLSYQQIRILPKTNGYILEIIYKVPNLHFDLDSNKIIGIDLGIDNLLTIANNFGDNPFIIKGKVVKSINQYYNKKRAELKRKLDNGIEFKKGIKYPDSKKLQRLTKKRNNKINDYFHKASTHLMEYCIDNRVSTIIIGYNETWKQKVNIGKRNNQKFVGIPFLKLIQMIQYKSEIVGIKVVLTEESYTSKCSVIDNESIEKHEIYQGKRIKRGLFQSKNGIKINADVNGAYNIIKKVVPITFDGKGIEGMVLYPKTIVIV